MLAELIEHYGTDLSAVNAARVSMDKESKWEYDLTKEPYTFLNDKDAKLIKYLADHNHASCFEHQGVTLRLKVPLFIRSQIHRHRTFSYNEISRRYVKSAPEFYWPDKWRKAAENVKQGSSDESTEMQCFYPLNDEYMAFLTDSDYRRLPNHKQVIETIVAVYEDMLGQGVAPEQARMILPQNLYTQFYMTGNLRNWVHFLKLRLDKHAQKEIQEIASQCAALIEPLFPVSYKALISVGGPV